MIGNNNFNFYYNNFLLNNNSFISPNQNVGMNNIPNKKPDNTSKTNIDIASLSQDTEINESDNNNTLNSFFGSLSNMANDDKSNINSKNQVPPKPNPLPSTNDILKYNFSEGNPYPSDVLKEMKFYLNSIKDSAKKTGIDEKLLYGILVAERMRYKPSDYADDLIHGMFKPETDTSKGLAQIKLNAALEGELYYRNNNKDPNDNIDPNDPNNTKAIEKLKSEINKDIVSLFSNDKNIEYSAKYISFLQSQFPQSNDLDQKEQHKLIAAAYKAGPEAVKNARMQEQLNDLLNLKGNNKLTTDGDPGTKTKDAIDDLISNTLPFAQMSYKNGDYSKIREVINLIWEKKHPDKKNPPGAVPIYNVTEWEKKVDSSVQDVLEAEKYYVDHKY